MAKAATPAAEKPRILLVDDQQSNLLALEVLLDEFDATLVRANSGNEALKMVLNQKIALVLLDIQMPDMDGYEVAELMQKNSRSQGIPVLFVTAINQSHEHVLKAYESGAVDILVKPLEPAILKRKVKVFLDLYRKNRELELSNNNFEASMRKLERLKQHADLLLESLGDAILRLDAEGRIQYANPAAAALLDDDQPLVGSLLSEHLVGDAEEDLVGEMLAHCLAGERSQFIAAVRRVDEVYAAEFTASPMTTESGENEGVSIVFKDISRRHKVSA
ncbi:MAG: response regulator [Pedobacter sp.]|nr:response regulator [Pedobacter sp.]